MIPISGPNPAPRSGDNLSRRGFLGLGVGAGALTLADVLRVEAEPGTRLDSNALYAALEANPDDIATLDALADWFEKNDQAKPAECVRWLAELGKVPFRYTTEADILHHFDGWKDGWYWWATAGEGENWGHPENCRLPQSLWGSMTHTFDYEPVVFKEYPTVRGAIEAVIAAWKRRPPKPPQKRVG